MSESAEELKEPVSVSALAEAEAGLEALVEAGAEAEEEV